MNFRSLAILSVLALSPIAISAQATALSAQAPAASPALYAETAAPVSFSSSIAADALVAPAAGAQSSSAPKASKQSSLPFSGLAIGVKVGLAGIGFDVATPLIHQWINLRGGASFISYTPSTITTDNLNINGTIKFQNAAAMVDVFPFHGRIRLSGGATIYNNTGLTASLAVPAGQSISFGGTTYYSEPLNANNPFGPITGSGVFTFGGNKVAPRVTIGTGNMLPKKGHFTFESEIGFQYFSAPTVTLNNFSGTACLNYTAPSTYTNCGSSSSVITGPSITSEETKLNNDLYDLRFFPILSFGLSYKIH
ncbi:MAG: hypothetical protein ABSE27_04060 [Acidobacteriaceae bacterium]|jgi:hypothetical protein